MQHSSNLARRLQAHRQLQSARTMAMHSSDPRHESMAWPQQRMQQQPQQPQPQLTPQQMQILARANTQPSSQLMMQMSPQTSAHAPGTQQSLGSEQLHPVYSAPSHTGGPPQAPTHSHALDTFLGGSLGQGPAGPPDFASLRTLSAAMQLHGHGGGVIDPAMAQLQGSGLTVWLPPLLLRACGDLRAEAVHVSSQAMSAWYRFARLDSALHCQVWHHDRCRASHAEGHALPACYPCWSCLIMCV